MTQTVEFDLKQMVLLNDTFGPREVRQMQEAIARDFSQYAVLRDAVGELQAQDEEPDPGQQRALGRLPVSAGPVLSGDRSAAEGRRRGDGPFLSGQVAFRPAKNTTRPWKSYQAAEKAGYDAGECALGRAEAAALRQPAAEALAVLDRLSGAIEQTAEYLSQRAATVAAMGGNPSEVVALYERAVEADRNHPGAPVRPGPGKRPPRQRRRGHGTLQARRRAAFPPTSAR